MVSSGLTILASRPVSSCTSRRAACSEVSPLETAPFGSPQRVRPRVAIMATYGRPSRSAITAPPEECSWRTLPRLPAAMPARFYGVFPVVTFL